MEEDTFKVKSIVEDLIKCLDGIEIECGELSLATKKVILDCLDCKNTYQCTCHLELAGLNSVCGAELWVLRVEVEVHTHEEVHIHTWD